MTQLFYLTTQLFCLTNHSSSDFVPVVLCQVHEFFPVKAAKIALIILLLTGRVGGWQSCGYTEYQIVFLGSIFGPHGLQRLNGSVKNILEFEHQ